jgi:hypothetical protein
MAQHIPIETTNEHKDLVEGFLSTDLVLTTLEFYKPHQYADNHFKRLSTDYFLHDNDWEVISISNSERTLEVHLDKDENIIQVYLIM